MLPPLRQRREDLPALIDRFWREITTSQRTVGTLQMGAVSALSAAYWPGNLDHLHNVIANLALALSVVACYRCRPVGLGLNPDSAPLHGLMASRYRGGGAVPRHHGGRESHPTSVSKLSRSHLLAGPPTCR